VGALLEAAVAAACAAAPTWFARPKSVEPKQYMGLLGWGRGVYLGYVTLDSEMLSAARRKGACDGLTGSARRGLRWLLSLRNNAPISS
jgi:hypothetical protein